MDEPVAPWQVMYDDDLTPAHLDYPDISMYEFVKQAADRFPAMCAIDYMGTRVSYSELINYIDRVSSCLYRLGIRKGDHVLVCLPNIPQAIYAIYAINRIGAVAVVTHPLSAKNELKFFIEECYCHLAITYDSCVDKFLEIRDVTPLDKIILASVGDHMSFTQKIGYDLLFGRKNPVIPKDDCLLRWRDFIKLTERDIVPKMDNRGADPAMILYSGGTTGTPKGVILSNLNINATAMETIAISECIPCKFDYVYTDKFKEYLDQYYKVLAVMPIFHGFGFSVGVHSFLTIGGTSILVPKFTPDTFAKLIVKHKPNFLAGVPTLYEHMTRSKYIQDADLSFLKGVFVGGDSLSPKSREVLDSFLTAHHSPVLAREGYGLTECVTVTCLTPKGQEEPGVIGIPVPDVYYKIVKQGTDKELPYGKYGEICISGPCVMIGYKNNEEETDNTLKVHSDGRKWLHTGDVGMMDRAGVISFKQRYKRIIISNGYNVYPIQVENILNSHPDVECSCVIGIPDELMVKKVKAYVVMKKRKDETPETIDALMDMCKSSVSKYSIPREIVFAKSLPRTKLGKIDYMELERIETEKYYVQKAAEEEAARKLAEQQAAPKAEEYVPEPEEPDEEEPVKKVEQPKDKVSFWARVFGTVGDTEEVKEAKKQEALWMDSGVEKIPKQQDKPLRFKTGAWEYDDDPKVADTEDIYGNGGNWIRRKHMKRTWLYDADDDFSESASVSKKSESPDTDIFENARGSTYWEDGSGKKVRGGVWAHDEKTISDTEDVYGNGGFWGNLGKVKDKKVSYEDDMYRTDDIVRKKTIWGSWAEDQSAAKGKDKKVVWGSWAETPVAEEKPKDKKDKWKVMWGSWVEEPKEEVADAKAKDKKKVIWGSWVEEPAKEAKRSEEDDGTPFFAPVEDEDDSVYWSSWPAGHSRPEDRAKAKKEGRNIKYWGSWTDTPAEEVVADAEAKDKKKVIWGTWEQAPAVEEKPKDKKKVIWGSWAEAPVVEEKPKEKKKVVYWGSWVETETVEEKPKEKKKAVWEEQVLVPAEDEEETTYWSSWPAGHSRPEEKPKKKVFASDEQVVLEEEPEVKKKAVYWGTWAEVEPEKPKEKPKGKDVYWGSWVETETVEEKPKEKKKAVREEQVLVPAEDEEETTYWSSWPAGHSRPNERPKEKYVEEEEEPRKSSSNVYWGTWDKIEPKKVESKVHNEVVWGSWVEKDTTEEKPRKVSKKVEQVYAPAEEESETTYWSSWPAGHARPEERPKEKYVEVEEEPRRSGGNVYWGTWDKIEPKRVEYVVKKDESVAWGSWVEKETEEEKPRKVSKKVEQVYAPAEDEKETTYWSSWPAGHSRPEERPKEKYVEADEEPRKFKGEVCWGTWEPYKKKVVYVRVDDVASLEIISDMVPKTARKTTRKASKKSAKKPARKAAEVPVAKTTKKKTTKEVAVKTAKKTVAKKTAAKKPVAKKAAAKTSAKTAKKTVAKKPVAKKTTKKKTRKSA